MRTSVWVSQGKWYWAVYDGEEMRSHGIAESETQARQCADSWQDLRLVAPVVKVTPVVPEPAIQHPIQSPGLTKTEARRIATVLLGKEWPRGRPLKKVDEDVQLGMVLLGALGTARWDAGEIAKVFDLNRHFVADALVNLRRSRIIVDGLNQQPRWACDWPELFVSGVPDDQDKADSLVMDFILCVLAASGAVDRVGRENGGVWKATKELQEAMK